MEESLTATSDEVSAFCLFPLAEKPVMLTLQYVLEITGTQEILPENFELS